MKLITNFIFALVIIGHMAEVGMTYLEDGEFLSINTNMDRGGSLITIEPAEHEVIAATDPSRGWTRMVSPAGHVAVNVPYDDHLSDWGLQLSGIPRMFEGLRLAVITALFTDIVTAEVKQYHRKYNSRRESVGDILAKYMRRGPLRLDEGFALYKSHAVITGRDINAETREARKRLLAQASEDSGRLVVARSTFILDV